MRRVSWAALKQSLQLLKRCPSPVTDSVARGGVGLGGGGAATERETRRRRRLPGGLVGHAHAVQLEGQAAAAVVVRADEHVDDVDAQVDLVAGLVPPGRGALRDRLAQGEARLKRAVLRGAGPREHLDDDLREEEARVPGVAAVRARRGEAVELGDGGRLPLGVDDDRHGRRARDVAPAPLVGDGEVLDVGGVAGLAHAARDELVGGRRVALGLGRLDVLPALLQVDEQAEEEPAGAGEEGDPPPVDGRAGRLEGDAGGAPDEGADDEAEEGTLLERHRRLASSNGSRVGCACYAAARLIPETKNSSRKSAKRNAHNTGYWIAFQMEKNVTLYQIIVFLSSSLSI